MKYKYVVIEREYGSGGTEIGKLLSEKTGIPCYGNEIQEAVSKNLNIPVSEIQHYEESATNSFLYSLYAFSKMGSESGELLSKEDQVFVEQQKLIKEYALHGPAIFVGRCAAKTLGTDGVLTVFIHADKECRKQRIIKEYGIAENSAESTMAKYDRKRKSYYSANTGKKWTDRSNYHMILDSGKLGIESCVKAIQSALEQV